MYNSQKAREGSSIYETCKKQISTEKAQLKTHFKQNKAESKEESKRGERNSQK